MLPKAVNSLGKKQPSRSDLRKRCSENMQQFYGRPPLPKCDFNKVVLQLYWNPTSAGVFSCKFDAYFQNTFFHEHLWRAASDCSNFEKEQLRKRILVKKLDTFFRKLIVIIKKSYCSTTLTKIRAPKLYKAQIVPSSTSSKNLKYTTILYTIKVKHKKVIKTLNK